MLIKQASDLRESEVTPRELYLRRREFIGAAGVTAAALATGVLAPGAADAQNPAAQKLTNLKKSPFNTDEKMNSYRDVTTYNLDAHKYWNGETVFVDSTGASCDIVPGPSTNPPSVTLQRTASCASTFS